MVEVAGEMRELGRAENAAYSREYRRSFLQQLLHIQESRGYKSGYASVKYLAKFGQMPNFRDLQPEPPKADVLAFVRAEARAYSAAMKQEVAA